MRISSALSRCSGGEGCGLSAGNRRTDAGWLDWPSADLCGCDGQTFCESFTNFYGYIYKGTDTCHRRASCMQLGQEYDPTRCPTASSCQGITAGFPCQAGCRTCVWLYLRILPGRESARQASVWVVTTPERVSSQRSSACWTPVLTCRFAAKFAVSRCFNVSADLLFAQEVRSARKCWPYSVWRSARPHELHSGGEFDGGLRCGCFRELSTFRSSSPVASTCTGPRSTLAMSGSRLRCCVLQHGSPAGSTSDSERS